MRSEGADEALLSEIYIKNMHEIARKRLENQKTNETENNLKEGHATKYVCDLCGQEFDIDQLDIHFAKTALQAQKILGGVSSGKIVTFNDEGKAWCPNCFKDAQSMSNGGRTVHQGEKKPYQ